MKFAYKVHSGFTAKGDKMVTKSNLEFPKNEFPVNRAIHGGESVVHAKDPSGEVAVTYQVRDGDRTITIRGDDQYTMHEAVVLDGSQVRYYKINNAVGMEGLFADSDTASNTSSIISADKAAIASAMNLFQVAINKGFADFKSEPFEV